VLIEAMACGVPSIASNRDASAEAVADGRFGIVVDPLDVGALAHAIEDALSRPNAVPDGLEIFDQPAFERRVHDDILGPMLERGPSFGPGLGSAFGALRR
jgi:phosphatidyl-myo-inositol dimannoside synthase